MMRTFWVPLLLSSVVSNASIPAVGVRIRVRVAEAIPLVTVRGVDLRIYEGGEERALAASTNRVTSWDLRCQNGRIRAISASGSDGTIDLKAPVVIQTHAGFLNLQGKPYREDLWIHSTGSLCDVVNVVDIEKYLDGVVNLEFSSKWNAEALDAQVIAARTYALHQIRSSTGSSKYFDVDSTVRDQRYGGAGHEDFRASRSVERTKGKILTVGSEGKASPLKAFYHSTCGGMTELPEKVWGAPSPGFNRRVPCQFCGGSPRISWELDASSTELAEAIARGVRSDGPLRGWPKNWEAVLRSWKIVEVLARHSDVEPRVSEVDTIWSNGESRMTLGISGAKFRTWMNSSRFRSVSFEVTSHEMSSMAGVGGWRFRGRGNGHGVGMCQWGAKVMGEKGYSSAAILKHYYPAAILRRLW